jgi:hypothetical protein
MHSHTILKLSAFLVNKTNRCNEFQFSLVIIILHVSGSLSVHHQELLSRTTELVQFMQLGDRVLPGSGRKFRPDPGSTRSPSCINCTNAVLRLRSSWWWSERLSETYRVIITNKNWNSVHLLVLFTRNLSRCTVIQSLKNSNSSLYLREEYSDQLAVVSFSRRILLHRIELNSLSVSSKLCLLSPCLFLSVFFFCVLHIGKIYGLKSPETRYSIGRNICNRRVESCFLESRWVFF